MSHLKLLFLLAFSGKACAWDNEAFGVEKPARKCSRSGLFSAGCGTEVIVCGDADYLFSVYCPFSLWFDEGTGFCVPPAAVLECSSPKTLPTVAAPVLPDGMCAGFDDGLYPASACSSSIVHCVDWSSTLFECPEGMFFSPIGCSDIRPEQCQKLPLNDDCVVSGKHNLGRCSSLYIQCENGESRVQACSWPLVFDVSRQSCEFDYEVAGCQKTETSLCPNDGLYAYGKCSSTFYSCFVGQISTMYCPLQLVFDNHRKVCVFPSAVPECSGEEDVTFVAENAEFGHTPVDPDFCGNRADGFYSQGCNSALVGCIGGVSRGIHCPMPLVFDERTVSCKETSEVDECKEKASLESRKKIEIPNRHPPSGNMFEGIKCRESSSRVYQLDCKGKFFYCVETMGYDMFCLNGFLYSEEAKACVPPSEYGKCRIEERPI